jgi:hypothetical protein
MLYQWNGVWFERLMRYGRRIIVARPWKGRTRWQGIEFADGGDLRLVPWDQPHLWRTFRSQSAAQAWLHEGLSETSP